MTRTRTTVGRALVALTLTLATGALAAAPTRATSLLEGTHEGADFLIGMPDRWNGGLVLFAHGYEGEGDGRGSVRGSPLAGHLAARGYAWAASGYRSRGYRPDWFLADTMALRARFIARFGPPRWTILHGQSMGGHVTIASLELHPEVYQGGLIECGIIDGVGLVDWLYAYTAAAEYLSGVRLLDAPDRQAFGALVNGPWLDAMGTPGAYTDRGRRFDSVVKHLMGGDLPLRLEGMRQRYIMNLNSRDPGPDRAQEFARHAEHGPRPLRDRPRPGDDGGRAQSRDPPHRPGPGCPLPREQPGVRRADRPDPRAPDDDPRDRRLPRPVPPAAGLPAPHARGRHVAPPRAARGALGRALRVRRHRPGARVRRPGRLDRARRRSRRATTCSPRTSPGSGCASRRRSHPADPLAAGGR